MIAQEKIDLIIQFALLVAGEEDDFRDRQLGPIHLIKYVYLADLFHAESKKGETFTGIDWQFFNFGPWSQTVHARIEPALIAIGAEKITFSSNFEDKDDWCRWSVKNEGLLDRIKEKLPIQITLRLEKEIHTFLKDTPGLLHHVYRTKPMVNAAPGDILNFAIARCNPVENENFSPAMQSLTARQRKKFHGNLEELRKKNQELLATRRSKRNRVKSLFEPVRDEVYAKGMEWLDSLAGEPIPKGNVEATFDDSIWTSPNRSLNDN